MDSLKLHPRGYMSHVRIDDSDEIRSSVNHVITVSGDARFKRLYDLFINQQVNTENFEYCHRVFESCSHLYGNFYQWLLLQVTANDYVYDYNLEYLKDTVLFIRTGQRQMHNVGWEKLLRQNPQPIIGCARKERLKDFNITPAEFSNYIGMWCSHYGGLADLLTTTNLLFGEIR